MNCQEFWSRPPANSGIPDAAWSAHLRECPACASAWAHHQNLAAGLRRVAAEWSSLEAPPRVERRLVNAFRAQAGLGTPTISYSRPWMGALAWATAAVTVLLLAISLVRIHEPQSASPRRAVENSAILASAYDLPDADSAESGFLPLPNVEQLAPNEEGDLVRLELPRSAMMALGFEVSPERAAETVQAEVLYGPDGVARAIRFLDDTF